VQRSEVKRSGSTLQVRDSTDYVVTSCRLDGPGSFPDSIFLTCFLLYFLFLVFCNVHVLVMHCAVFVRCMCCFLVECMVFVKTVIGHKPSCS
jgi:hypothetical protein